MTQPPQDEVEALRARVAQLEGAAPRRHPLRSVLSTVLIVLACLLAPLGVLASWTANEMGDTDRYVDTVAPLAGNPDVQEAVAGRVTNAVMENLDVRALLQDVAPDDRPRLEKALGPLGGTLDKAVRSFVHDRAQDVVASDAFGTIWTEANRRIHKQVDKALTGSGGGSVKLTDDAVTLDLGPAVEELKQRLVDDGLKAAGKIPEVHTDFTLLESDKVGKAKTGFRLLQIMGTWLPVLALLLAIGGVLLAGRRRRAVIATALGVAAATAILGIALTVFRTVYLDALPAGVSQPAAGSVYDTLVRFLRTTVRMVIALGIVVALAAWLTGGGRRAGLVRGMWHSGIGAVRTTAERAGMRTGPVGPWVRRYRRWITWVLLAAALLVYWLWDYPTGWTVLGIALVLLLVLAVVEFLAGDNEEAEELSPPGPAQRPVSSPR